jgi:23S rRNA (guanosine2251-2'-O)-methyltransferase
MKRRLAGPRSVTEALRANVSQIVVVYFDPQVRSAAEVAKEAGERGARVEEKTARDLDALTPDGLRHQGILAISGEYSYVDLDELMRQAGERPLLVALDEITDPHNLGAIIRSAVALGANGILTLKDRAAPVTGVAVRAAAGATEHARIARVTNLSRTLAELAERDLQIVGLAGEGDTLISELPEAPAGRVLVIGSEGKGLRPLVRKHCQVLARIDLPGAIASLNASVAAGIALYEASRQR